MTAGPRYADLRFKLHAHMSAEDADRLCQHYFPLAADHRVAGPVCIEQAIAECSNGHIVSVLRGMCTAGAAADYETCRMHGDDQPIKHRTIESVQAELDAVAALPPLRQR